MIGGTDVEECEFPFCVVRNSLYLIELFLIGKFYTYYRSNGVLIERVIADTEDTWKYCRLVSRLSLLQIRARLWGTVRSKLGGI